MERRIAAILASDMVGFSRLMEIDEVGTLERQKRHRLELIDPEIARHNGSIIKLTGDGLIAEFGSVVEAVQFAVRVQKEMLAREADVPEDRRIRYRIAVHLGDVVFDDGDVYGDGVNIAARLEGLAEPGGVVVSGTAHDLLKAQVDVGYRSLGERKLKNISTPVRVYQVTDRQDAPRLRRERKWLVPALAVALAAVAALGWLWTRPDFTPVDPSAMALELPRKPSIAVLPFALRGEDAADGWIADGITDSIISTLSLSPDMIVIARSTMFGYKNRDVDAAEVARRLGVRYILSGSVQKAGKKLRVTTELADAVKGRLIWSMQKDSAPDDLFAMQDDVARKVFEELSVSLTVGESTRNWIENVGGFENYVTVINGRAEFQKFSTEGHANAERIWGELHRKFPQYAFTHYLMGYIHWQKVSIGISQDPAADWAEAERLAKKAIEISEFGEAYTLSAFLELGKGNHDAAIEMADRAIALSPGSSDANALAGAVKAASGQPREGLELMELGMRLEPDYPDWLPGSVNFARLELGRYDEAKSLAREVLASDIKDVRAKPAAAAVLTAVAVFEGDMDEARRQAQVLMSLYPKASRSNMPLNLANHRNQGFVERYIDALVKAGIPDN